MRGLSVALALAFYFGGCVPACAASTAHWYAIDRDVAEERIELAKGISVPLLTLVPQRLYKLSARAVVLNSTAYIPEGTLMMPVGDGSDRKLCAVERHLGSAFRCLSDVDGNGSFDTFFAQQVFNEFYFGSAFSDEAVGSLYNEVNVAELDPFTEGPVSELRIMFIGGGGETALRFKTCTHPKSASSTWRLNGLYDEKCLKKEIKVLGRGFPREFQFYGADIVVNGIVDGKLDVVVKHKANVTGAIFLGSK